MTERRGFRHKKEAIKEPYHYTACGLDNVYLLGGYEVHQTDEGEGVSIRDLDGLHRAIGLSLAQHKKFLQPKEFRWFRKQLDLTQSELASFLECDAQTVARWEKGENNMRGAADRLVRVLYIERVEKGLDVRKLLESLVALDDVEERQTFEATADGWKMAQAA